MNWIVRALGALLIILLATHAQPPPPVQTDPLALSGGLIDEKTGQSCDAIFVGDPDSDGESSSLNCNKATVLILQVPLTPTTGDGVTFDFNPNGQSGGGVYHTPPGECAKGPGYCLFGQPFRINIKVSPVATAYDLTAENLVAPFAYTYENCLSTAPATNSSFYPYYSEGTCGTGDIWNWDDYHSCNSQESWPYWYAPEVERPAAATSYSKCAFMCGWELEKVQSTLPAGKTLADWCNNNAVEGTQNVRDVAVDYFSDGVTELACDRATAWTGDIKQFIMPNFPKPTGFCPCAGSATTVDKDTSAKPDGSVQQNGPFSSIVACKSCSGAGSCGTALPRPEPTNVTFCADTTDDVDTVCECVPGVDNNFTEFTPENDPVNDPNTVCFNTEQRHRCLKCQPTLTEAGDPHDPNKYVRNETCAYVDINQYAFCPTYWEDICGAGDFTLSDRQRDTNGNGDSTAASIGTCNCKAMFIERAYWVAPFCAPYRIENPAQLQYAITIELRYGGTEGEEQYDKPVPNGTMVVGSGFSPFFDPGDPIGDGSTSAILSWLNATVDGFAVSEILSEYTKSGGLTTNLPGSIVMCNNGQAEPQYCGFSTTNDDIGSSNIPNPKIRTANRTGFSNPWAERPDPGMPPVPLPDFIYNMTAAGDLEANQGMWWYYLSQEEIDTFGLACGANGWRLTGSADTASSYTMCNNLQGTCIPGIDRQFRGEAVRPPCSVAVDFLNYAVKFRNVTNPRVRPPHVPPSWAPELPTYTVHRGKLFRYDDPVVVKKYAAAQLRISVAADFAGETVVQADGDVVTSSKGCTITTADGLGVYYVDATNKGTMAAQYAFKKGECTPGLQFDTQIASIDPGDTPTEIALSIVASSCYGNGEPECDANSQSCSILMTPSLAQNDVLGTTALTQCIPQFGLPQIQPILSANVSYTESIADSTYTNFVNGPGCGFICSLGDPFSRKSFLTPREWQIITFFLTVLVAILVGAIIMCVCQYTAASEAKEASYQATVLQEEKHLRAKAGVMAEWNLTSSKA